MPEILEKWIMRRHTQLWSSMKNKGFSLQEASKILQESPQVTAVILSRLRKAGWISAEIDAVDYRRTVYHLISPEEVINKIGDERNAQNY